MRAALLWPDVEAWAVTYLIAALAARSEPFADGVTVRTQAGSTLPARLVTVRDDGGRRDDLSRTTSLGVNVWAETDADCSDLARMVASLLEASAGDGPVVACLGTNGPMPVVEESDKPHRYLSADLVVTGSPLT